MNTELANVMIFPRELALELKRRRPELQREP